METRSFLSTKETRILGGIEYEIKRVVGCGSSTIVYEASYMDALNKNYAHKVLIKELYPYDESKMIYRDDRGFLGWDSCRDKMMEDYKSFFRKGNEMNIRLLEKNPKEVSGNLNSFEAYGTYYSVLPLHGGNTLEKYLEEQGGRISSVQESAAILQQILDALRLFHENELLNLDVSPDNILLLDGRCMFIDYNSVWDLTDPENDCFLSQKEGYTAPEILLQEFDEIGYGSDLYSVTAVFYEMLLGEKFDLKHRGWEKIPSKVDQFLKKNSKEKSKNLQKRQKEELCHILKQGLHPLTDKRFQSVEEYEKAIQVFLQLFVKKTVDEKALKTKSFVSGAAGLLLILLGILGGRHMMQEKPWLPRIISQGNTNANLYNKARFCVADLRYEYYIDQDGNLVMTSYDEEADGFDPMDTTVAYGQKEEVDGDGVDFLNLGTDSAGQANKLYFCYYGGEDRADSIMSMNLDGSGQEVLFTHDEGEVGDYYSYAHLADGREYIYYMVGPEVEDGVADDYTLWRYDIKKQEKELLIDTSVQWFNVYDKYIYYIEYDYDTKAYHLMQASLDGAGNKLLDDHNQYFGGFVQDDRLYLERFLENEYSIQSCDLNGKILYDKQGIYGLDLSDIEIAYGDGWIYYSREGQEELRKVRLDGTADKLVHAGMDCYAMNCVGNYLFVSVAAPAEGNTISYEDVMDNYMIERNGEDCRKVK